MFESREGQVRVVALKNVKIILLHLWNFPQRYNIRLILLLIYFSHFHQREILKAKSSTYVLINSIAGYLLVGIRDVNCNPSGWLKD